MAFGLGAGPCFYYLPFPGVSPSRFTNGRTRALERDFAELTGLPLALHTAEDAGDSWSQAQAVVDSGRPALLLTDLYYLDHYGKSAHFPGHAVVLAGYDGERAYLSDTAFEDLQTTSLESLAKARHSQHMAAALSGDFFEVPAGADLENPSARAPEAIARAVRNMLEPEFGEYQGLPAVQRLAGEVEGWPEELDDWQWCARFAYQTIERRGTGGGNFRLMYADFLSELQRPEEGLAREASAAWTDLADAFMPRASRTSPNRRRGRPSGSEPDESRRPKRRPGPASPGAARPRPFRSARSSRAGRRPAA
jgi:hypothetical protein